MKGFITLIGKENVLRMMSYPMSDPVQVKQDMLQMNLAMMDTTSLPWPAVRAAWASSMHQVEEGNLTWADSTQWVINRLRASQIALSTPIPKHRHQYSRGPVNTTMKHLVCMRTTMGLTCLLLLS